MKKDKIDYVIQINGKKRAILNDNRDMLSYRIYRDGEFLVETDLNTFSYIDSLTDWKINRSIGT